MSRSHLVQDASGARYPEADAPAEKQVTEADREQRDLGGPGG